MKLLEITREKVKCLVFKSDNKIFEIQWFMPNYLPAKKT